MSSPAFTKHALDTIENKGFRLQDVQDALNDPEITYQSHEYPHQRKYIGRGLCVVVDMERNRVVTVFKHLVRTALRPDQRG